MDLIEILLLLAFVFFPLVQSLLARIGKRGGDAELPPPRSEGEEPTVPDARRERSPAQVTVSGPPAKVGAGGGTESWSSDWGSWPGDEGATTDAVDTFEELSAEEVVTEEQADELIAYQERLAAREMPEAARVTVPVVSMEPLRVDRRAEHRRLHERMSPLATHQRRSPPPGAGLGAALRTNDEVRRAILLSEILGPPRSMQ